MWKQVAALSIDWFSDCSTIKPFNPGFLTIPSLNLDEFIISKKDAA